MWKLAKSFKRTTQIKRSIHRERGLVFTDTDIAEAFADYMVKQFTINPMEDCDAFQEHLFREVRNKFNNQDAESNLEPIKVEEHQLIIKGMNPKKALGIDKITNKMIKFLPNNIILNLVQIFNNCLNQVYFPNKW